MAQLFDFIGFNEEIWLKIFLTLVFIILLWLLRRIANNLTRELLRRSHNERIWFWTGQGVNLATTVLLILGLLTIWFDNPNHLTTVVGLITAGVAFALQKVITAIAGYLTILRSNIFSVGDRIQMGGVRGDVISLSFIQTTIMEMGQPPSLGDKNSSSWVKSRVML